MAGPFSAADLAARLGARLEGDGALLLRGLAGLEEAGGDQLSFLANRRYGPALRATRAGAVLVALDEEIAAPCTLLRVADPYLAFAQALAIFAPLAWPAPGVHPSAVVAPDAVVEGATIEALAFVGAGAVVGPGTWIEPGVVIGPGARIGASCRLMARSVVMAGCVLGDRVWLNPGAVVGGEGFGFVPTAQGPVKIPQTGIARVDDDVEIGSNSCVDRAALGETRVRRGARLDNLVQVGHAADIGPGSLLVAFAGVAGSARLGAGVVLAARAAILGHLQVGDRAQVGAGSVVTAHVPAGSRVSGTPAIAHGRWLAAAAAFGDLPGLLRRLRGLEAQVEAMAARPGDPPHPLPRSGT